MSTYMATITWHRNEAVFTDNRYSRAHVWQFDGGCTVPASSSPHVVPLPFSDASAVDPEEAFVASLSSCHMLKKAVRCEPAAECFCHFVKVSRNDRRVTERDKSRQDHG